MVARQEAILAAISEKDAHIAVLEMAPNKKTENIEEVEKLTKEKLRLQQVLKDLVSEFTCTYSCISVMVYGFKLAQILFECIFV